jgi:hypothetical protein
MRADLAVDKLEAAPCFCNLLSQVAGKLSQKIAVRAGGSFGVEAQLCNFPSEQRVPLGIERGDIAFGMLNLSRNAEKLGCSAFTRDGGANLAVIVKQTLQRLGVAATVGLIGACHQQGKVLLLGVVTREVWMDALRDIAKEGPEAGRWVELLSFTRLAKCSIVGLLCTLTCLLSSAPGRVGVIEIDFALSDARFKIIEFGVQNADLPEVTTFKRLELRTNLGELRLTLSELRAHCCELLALIKQRGVVRGLLEDDFS